MGKALSLPEGFEHLIKAVVNYKIKIKKKNNKVAQNMNCLIKFYSKVFLFGMQDDL